MVNYAFLTKHVESRRLTEARKVTFNTLHEAAHATPWLVLASMVDDDNEDLRKLRNILVHAPESSTIVVSDAVRDSFEQLLTLFKSFQLRSSDSVRPTDLVALTNVAERYSAISRWLHGGLKLEREDPEWNDEKNERRCQLVDRDIDGTITPAEKEELDDLQQQVLDYRRRVAPLPLEDVRQLHQELLKRATERDNEE